MQQNGTLLGERDATPAKRGGRTLPSENCGEATGNNTKKNPVEYFNEIMEQIRVKNPDPTSSGGIARVTYPMPEYLKEMFVIAHIFPDTKFMCLP